MDILWVDSIEARCVYMFAPIQGSRTLDSQVHNLVEIFGHTLALELELELLLPRMFWPCRSYPSEF